MTNIASAGVKKLLCMIAPILGALIAVFAVFLSTAEPAVAQVCGPKGVNVGFIDSGAKAANKCSADGKHSNKILPENSVSNQSETNEESPTSRSRYVRACLEELTDISISCEILAPDCPDDSVLLERYTARTDQAPPQWQPTGEVTCSDSMEAEELADFPGYTLDDFQSLPFSPGASSIQPSPHTLRGAETNVYARATEQTFSADITGFSVEIIATPNAYTWSYGDGHSLGPISSGGVELPRERWGEETSSSHQYEETGDFDVALTTHFTGMYSVDGGPWIPIPGQASVPSEPVTISVWRSETNNYADNCLEDPQGAGCQGAAE